MVSLNWLKDGLVFTSAKFFKHPGAYTHVPQRPGICDKCDSRSAYSGDPDHLNWKTICNLLLVLESNHE